MGQEFQYDVFLSHSAKDKAVVRPLAERKRQDRLRVWFDEWVLKPGDSVPAKIEEGLEHSRVLVLCISANAFGADWAQLETGTFQLRDPLKVRKHSRVALQSMGHVRWPDENCDRDCLPGPLSASLVTKRVWPGLLDSGVSNHDRTQANARNHVGSRAAGSSRYGNCSNAGRL